MFRKSQENNIAVTFQYSHGNNEIGSSTTEDLSSPEEFLENYQQLCLDKKTAIDLKNTHFHKATYSINISGKLNGKDINKTFISMEAYHNFLIRSDLIPNAIRRLVK